MKALAVGFPNSALGSDRPSETSGVGPDPARQQISLIQPAKGRLEPLAFREVNSKEPTDVARQQPQKKGHRQQLGPGCCFVLAD